MDITTKGVSIKLSGKEIVHEASIRVRGGQMVGLFGPNGSGKSTLLKSIYRVLKPQAGEILFDDIPLEQIPRQETAKKLAVVTQFTT
ncbi:MAG: ATP-binding cassette domain-containing protein, partial [Clostridia bacterium]|nr:ATP-binding cassette domain-containing protein [Clostridia bacterium]